MPTDVIKTPNFRGIDQTHVVHEEGYPAAAAAETGHKRNATPSNKKSEGQKNTCLTQMHSSPRPPGQGDLLPRTN
jgi:hypothetical protein